MNPFVGILLVCLSLSFEAYGKVRKVEVTQDQIVAVHTAIGIATIIQVPDRPNSVVVGDQDKFKVEYLDQAITIKPIQSGAKSNLYVYTDYQRFNVQLITGAQSDADYVVYIDAVKIRPKGPALKWTSYVRSFVNDQITFEIQRLGRSRDGILLIEFRLVGHRKEIIKPEWFWLTQEGQTKPVQNLFIASLELSPSDPIKGTIQILLKDIADDKPLRIEMRRKKTSFLTLPKVTAWK